MEEKNQKFPHIVIEYGKILIQKEEIFSGKSVLVSKTPYIWKAKFLSNHDKLANSKLRRPNK